MPNEAFRRLNGMDAPSWTTSLWISVLFLQLRVTTQIALNTFESADLGLSAASQISRVAAGNPGASAFSAFALQSILHAGSDHAQATAALEKMEDWIIHMAKDKASRKHGTSDDNMTAAIETIIVIVNQSMMTGILDELAIYQAQLDGALKAFDTCLSALNASWVESEQMNATVPNKTATHQQCRFEENSMWYIPADCDSRLAAINASYQVAQLKCDNMSTEMPTDGRELCDNRNGSAQDHYRSLYEFWNEYLGYYDGNMSSCESLRQEVENMSANCTALRAVHANKRQECNNYQAKLDTQSCEFVHNCESGCSTYESCYNAALLNFNATNTTVAEMEKSLKEQWRACLRIGCYAYALNSSNVTWEIEQCIGTTYETHEVSINYADPPPNQNDTYPVMCSNLTDYVPITTGFYDAHFQGLPANAPAELRFAHFCQTKSSGTQVIDIPGGSACPNNQTFIPVSAASSSSSISSFTPGLDGANSWAPAQAQHAEYLQVDLGSIANVIGMVVQGGSSAGKCIDSWVSTYTALFSLDGVDFASPTQVLRGSNDCDTKVHVYLNNSVSARHVRFRVETWHGWSSMRIGVILCE